MGSASPGCSTRGPVVCTVGSNKVMQGDRNLMSMPRPLVALVRVGDPPVDVLEGIIPLVEERFPGRACRLGGAGLPVSGKTYMGSRKQFQANPLLDDLSRTSRSAERVLG